MTTMKFSARSSRSVACSVSAIVLGVLSTSCSEGTTPPGSAPPSMKVLRGQTASDTIQSYIPQAITVELRDPDGKPRSGVAVRFQAPGPADTTKRHLLPIYICHLGSPFCGPVDPAQFVQVDTTGSDGLASVYVTLGLVAGTSVVRISAPEFSLTDSAVFNILPGAPAKLRAHSADTTLFLGTSSTLGGRVFDRANNARADATTLSAGPGSAISVATTTNAVTAQELGEQWLYVRAGNLLDSTLVRSAPYARLVAYDALQQNVHLINSDGTGLKILQNNVYTEFGSYPRFTADRKSVLFYGHRINNGEAVLMDTSNTPRREFTQALGLRGMQALRVLPDGNVLIVAMSPSRSPVPEHYFVWRVAPDNSITQVRALPGLLSDRGGHADISPDGTRVAYQSYVGVPSREIRVIDLATGNSVMVASNGNSPQWNAKGDRLLYLDGALEGPAIIVNADGSGRRNVTRSLIFRPGVSWSPDGAYFIGTSAQFPDSRLRIVRVADYANVVLKIGSGSREPDWR